MADSESEDDGSIMSEENDADNFGTVSTDLQPYQQDLLIELFDTLDIDNDGKLNVKDFRRLGEVMTGTRPTKDSALAQLKRASLKGDLDYIVKDEWLAFSANLAGMDKLYFKDCIGSYIGKLKLIQKEKDHKIQAIKEAQRAAEARASEKLDEYAKMSVKK